MLNIDQPQRVEVHHESTKEFPKVILLVINHKFNVYLVDFTIPTVRGGLLKD